MCGVSRKREGQLRETNKSVQTYLFTSRWIITDKQKVCYNQSCPTRLLLTSYLVFRQSRVI